MKKLFFLIITIILITGCVDYKELNSLSYVTGLGVDYIDEEFIVVFEITDNTKEGDTVVPKTYTVDGVGSTYYEAHINATEKLKSTPYFSHTQIIVLSENVTKEKITDITDYVIRNPKLNEEFLFVITNEDSPKDIFENTSETNPSVSFYLTSLIKDNTYSKNYYTHLPFASFTRDLAEGYIDPAVSKIKIDEEEFIFDGLAVFNDTNLVTTLSKDNANIYNAFNSQNTSIVLTSIYNDSSIETITQFEKIDISITETDIDITVDVIVEIKKSPDNADLFDDDVYNEIADLLSIELNNKINDLMINLQKYNSDILGLENVYYKSTRKDNNELWTKANVNIDTNLSISRKGLIYNAD